jgi:hypothetical protein
LELVAGLEVMDQIHPHLELHQQAEAVAEMAREVLVEMVALAAAVDSTRTMGEPELLVRALQAVSQQQLAKVQVVVVQAKLATQMAQVMVAMES